MTHNGAASAANVTQANQINIAPQQAGGLRKAARNRPAMVRKIVHGLAALEAGAVLLLTAYLLDFGIKNSAIVLLCFGALPLMFLSAAVLVFQSSKSRVPRAAAVLLVLAPVLALTASGLDEAVSKLRWHDYASGRGYFSGADAWALGAAVMRGDAAAVAIAARSTDVNQVGKWDKTFLGLALSKRIVDAHQGTIVVESELGVGTTMRVRLPTLSSGVDGMYAHS